MMNNGNKERFVISIGGSLIVPQHTVDTEFLKGLNTFVRKLLHENSKRQFFLVTGGGWIARHYRDAGAAVVGHELTVDDLDWLGIHATRLNGHLLRTIFRDIAHPYLIKHYDIIRKVDEPIAIAAGWKPGWSTDYDAVLLCEDYSVKTVINLSNIDHIYNKDPRKFKDAKMYDKISWKALRALVGDQWVPGMHMPFDPIASQRAEELGVTVAILKGGDWSNLEQCVHGKRFVGQLLNNILIFSSLSGC